METLTNPCTDMYIQTDFAPPSLALQGFRHVGTDIYSIGCMILYTLSPAICRLMELPEHSMCFWDEDDDELKVSLNMIKIMANFLELRPPNFLGCSTESDVKKTAVFTLAAKMIDEHSGLQASDCLNQLRELQSADSLWKDDGELKIPKAVRTRIRSTSHAGSGSIFRAYQYRYR
eukprot:TRINITY_DN9193_c0_g1_i5.p1 TRINITY_DN9193_c0_g1~~TRINITY_DN9193_c0_g1_i5.p1  ORF type:complete len:175 (+),score=13.09 TRINITY_DN9193_c0_g1_i5:588-1112(+)